MALMYNTTLLITLFCFASFDEWLIDWLLDGWGSIIISNNKCANSNKIKTIEKKKIQKFD